MIIQLGLVKWSLEGGREECGWVGGERQTHENINLLVACRRVKELEKFIFLLSQSFVLVTQSTEWAKECAQNMMELAFRKTNR